MVCRIITDPNFDHSCYTHQQDPLHSEPRQLAADYHHRGDHAGWHVATIIANWTMAGSGSLTDAVLASAAADAYLVRRVNAGREGVVDSAKLDLRIHLKMAEVLVGELADREVIRHLSDR